MSREQDIEQVLDLIRGLVKVIKDGSIPDAEADKILGQTLVKLDSLMQHIDAVADRKVTNKIPTDHVKDKIKIDAPTKTKRTKK